MSTFEDLFKDPSTSPIRDQILSVRREQKDRDGNLIPIPSDLYQKATRRLEKLKTMMVGLEPESEQYDLIKLEADSILEAVSDIKETRAWLLWSLAWSEAGNESDMLLEEIQCYRAACSIAEKIRGEV